MSQLTKNRFDYELLGTDTKIVVQQKTSEIRSRMNKAATNIMEIGERLIAVKEQLGHGHFLNWLEAEFSWGETTAKRMMGVVTAFKSTKLDDLQIAPSALYLLSSDSTPEEVRDRFIEQAKEGKKVTHAEVKKVVHAERLKSEPSIVTKEEYEDEIVDTETGEVFDDASKKKKKEYGGISPKAMMPVRGHSKPDPKVALELPRANPKASARTLLSIFDNDYLREVIKELEKGIAERN